MRKVPTAHCQIVRRRDFAELVRALAHRAGGVMAFTRRTRIPRSLVYDWMAERRRGLTPAQLLRLVTSCVADRRLEVRLERAVRAPTEWPRDLWEPWVLATGYRLQVDFIAWCAAHRQTHTGPVLDTAIERYRSRHLAHRVATFVSPQQLEQLRAAGWQGRPERTEAGALYVRFGPRDRMKASEI